MGDGRTIEVAKHVWLPHAPIFLQEPTLNMRVCELIDEDTGQWDRGKVFTTFAQRTCEEILETPLNNVNSRDVLVWQENKAKKFTVRTAYRVAVRTKNPMLVHDVEPRSAPRSAPWLNVPPKVRTFLWRACSNCIPTKENLLKRRARVEAKCEICCQKPETASHVLWECAFARNVRSLSNGRTQKCKNEAVDFFLLFEQMRRKLDQLELERWATTAWAIWNARKRFYFEHVQVHPRIIFDGAITFLEEYQRLMSANV